MGTLVVTGTGTDIGKTVVTAAVAALATAAGRRVAVLKPAQTGVAAGEPGDADEVARLAGPVTHGELARYPEPLAPATAARRSGLPPVTSRQVADETERLAAGHDLVLVEGAGGLLVRYDETGSTLADVCATLRDRGRPTPVLLVVTAGLGSLDYAALSAEALRRRELHLLGAVIGSWPEQPDLATRCNLTDLPEVLGAPLLGALPRGCAALGRERFRAAAREGLAPALGGRWDAAVFASEHAARPWPAAVGVR